MIRASIRCTFALSIAMTNVVIAQESKHASDPNNTPNAIQAVDQLIEQNHRLEEQNQQIEKQNQELGKQNQQLMEQIKALRGAVTQDTNVSKQTAEPASAQATGETKAEQTGQSSSQKQSTQSSTQNQTVQWSSQKQNKADDNRQLPQASEGNPVIFGE